MIVSFNAVPHVADPIEALGRLRRLAGGEALLAVTTWGQSAQCEMRDVFAALDALLGQPSLDDEGAFSLSAPGQLEGLIEAAGCSPAAAGDVRPIRLSRHGGGPSSAAFGCAIRRRRVSSRAGGRWLTP